VRLFLKPSDIRRIREKLGLDRTQFADLLGFTSRQALINIETGFRNPNRLATRLLRFLDGISKNRSKEFIEEFLKYESK